MIKPVLFLGTLLLSLNASATSIADLNTMLHKTTHQKTTKTPPQMVYAGRDILKPQIVNEATTSTIPTEVSYS